MMSLPRLRSACLAIHACAAGFTSQSVLAQEAGALEEITVTAQRQAENLQDVPISISVTDADTAAKMGVRSSIDIAVAAPAVLVLPTGGGSATSIRGINSAAASGDESSNAFYIDGVYQASTPGQLFALNNIERIEVLKGPQGTLFGRNATGGVIQIITREPQQTTDIELEVGYGNFDTSEVKFYGTTGITAKLSADLAVYYQDQGEGWGHNIFDGSEAFAGDAQAYRSKLRWEISDAAQLVVAGHYSDIKPASLQGTIVPPGERDLAGNVGRPGFSNANENWNTSMTIRQYGGSATLNWDLGAVRLVNIAAYNQTIFDELLDQDASTVAFVNADILREAPTWTEEFQLLSPVDARIQWIGGLFYFHNKEGFEPSPLRITGAAAAAAGGVSDLFSLQTTDSYAAYGQAVFPVSGATSLTLGGRYTRDERSYEALRFSTSNPNGFGGVDQEATFDKVTWRASLDHQFTTDVLGYASYSRGFKSGLFNISSTTNPPVEPQVLDAYEVGVKSELFGRRLRANASAFYYEFEDIQVNQLVVGANLIVNAAGAELKGIDLDLEAIASEHLTLRGALSYLDGRYTEFPNAPYFFPNPAGGFFQCPPGPTSPPALVAACAANGASTTNAAGNRTRFSPEWVATASALYSVRGKSGDLSLAVTYQYNDGYFWDPQNAARQEAYDLVNATLGWDAPSGKWGIELWGQNLLDEEYLASLNRASFSSLSYPAPPRTYGISFSMRIR